jgi:hypothetical protein
LERTAEASPRFKARIAGVFYLLTFVTGILALMSVNGRLVADLAATACYVAVILKVIAESLLRRATERGDRSDRKVKSGLVRDQVCDRLAFA